MTVLRERIPLAATQPLTYSRYKVLYSTSSSTFTRNVHNTFWELESSMTIIAMAVARVRVRGISRVLPCCPTMRTCCFYNMFDYMLCEFFIHISLLSCVRAN